MSNQFSAILSACAGPVAIFIDFDGTLVEIAPTPDAVDVPDALADRLRSLAQSLEGALAVVTGRTIADIDHFLPGQDFAIAGSHGQEVRQRGNTRTISPLLSAQANSIATQLSSVFANDNRILIEQKPAGIAAHYRAAPERKADVYAAMHSALEGKEHFHTVSGKKVIEARPGGIDKGTAMQDMLRHPPFHGRIPVFIGDDVTDEDGFRTANALGGVSIKIGDGNTIAQFRLPDVKSVQALLAELDHQAAQHSQQTQSKEALQ